MISTWFSLIAFLAISMSGYSQIHERTNSHVQWNGLAFLKGTGNLAAARDNCGIYSTVSDRQSRTLSLSIDCRAEDHKIKPAFVKDKSAIKIVRKDETRSFLRNDIYGYRDCQGNEFHFFDGMSYQLMNPGESIAIYRLYQPKGKHRAARFFFASSSGGVEPLTVENLEYEFSDEPLFLEKLQTLAQNNFELVKYLFLINRVRDSASTNF